MTHEVKSQKLVEFSRHITMDTRYTVVTNGVVEQFQYPNISPTPDIETLVAVVDYFNKIIDAMKQTKRQYNGYHHNHRTAAEKVRKHTFTESDSSPACAICGFAPEAVCHHRVS